MGQTVQTDKTFSKSLEMKLMHDVKMMSNFKAFSLFVSILIVY